MKIVELFEQNLTELVNAPDQEIYHWTSGKALKTIFLTNTIKGKTEHFINNRNVQGVSFSRNPLFDLSQTNAITGVKPWRLGLNLQKLKADHKIFPWRFEDYQSIPRQKRFRSFGQGLVSSDEAEEFCVGDIFPMWHYVTSLAVEMNGIYLDHPEQIIDWAEEDAEDDVDPLDHNLLFDIMVGTYYGQSAYLKAWNKKKKRAGIRLPVPFYAICREKNKIIPFREVANDFYDKERFPDEEPDDFYVQGEGDIERYDRNSMFNQTTRKRSEF